MAVLIVGTARDETSTAPDESTPSNTYVHYLRRKLGRGVIHTVHGTGYRLGAK